MGIDKIKVVLKGKNMFQWGAELIKLGIRIWDYELGDIHIYRKNGEWICEIRK